MKKYGRNIITVLLAASFLLSLFMMFRQRADKSIGQDTYEQAKQLATSSQVSQKDPSAEINTAENTAPKEKVEYGWIPAPAEETDPHVQYMKSIDLAVLRQTNPDVLGWIFIPDTEIDFPLLQGEDNTYYLKRTWKGERNSMGSIFLETQNAPDFTDFNTIIYGHNMNNGSMFADIKQYCEQEYAKQHPYVYILSNAGVYRYEVFAAYEADVESATYGLSFNQRKTRINFLAEAAENSLVDMGIEPELTDRIITLSTCTGTGYSSRWVVQACLKMIYAAQQ